MTIGPHIEGKIKDLLKEVGELRKMPALGLDEAIAKLETNIRTFQEKLRAGLDDLDVQFRELLKAYDDLKLDLMRLTAKPHGLVTFVRFVRMEKLDPFAKDSEEVAIIDVKDTYGRVVRVHYVDKNKDVRELRFGQLLLVSARDGSANHALEALDEFKTEGTIGSITEVLSADHMGARFLVTTTREGAPQAMRAISSVQMDLLQKDVRVLVDAGLGLVLEALPPAQTSDTYLVAEVPDVTFADIGGLDALKREIEVWLIHTILFPETAKRMGESRPKGGVLEGPPGLGKTMLAKALANRLHELRCAQLKRDPTTVKPLFYAVNGPELLNEFIGVTERRIRELFAEARRKSADGTLVCIFIDEAEALVGIRGSGISSDMEKTIVPMFTSEMQGLEESGAQNIFVLLASNLAHNIDSAVKRPGRCDQIITVPRPDKSGAVQILEKYLAPTWEQIHPKYKVDVYDRLDEFGKPLTDTNGKPIRLQFAEDAAEARKYLIDRTVERIFEDTERNEVVRLTYEGEGQQVVRYCDLVSGAVLANVVQRAKRFARTRYTDSLEAKGRLMEADELVKMPAEDLIKMGIEPIGVKVKDMLEAVEKVYAEMRVPNDSYAMRHWLLVENLAQGRHVNNLAFTPRKSNRG